MDQIGAIDDEAVEDVVYAQILRPRFERHLGNTESFGNIGVGWRDKISTERTIS